VTNRRSLSLALVAITCLTGIDCERATKVSAATAARSSSGDSASPASRAAAPELRSRPTRYGGSHARPRDIAAQWVRDQLSGVALDSARCLSPRALRCAGPVAVVSDFAIDTALVAGDTARVIVRYTTIGMLTGGDSAIRYTQRPAGSLGTIGVDTVFTVRDSVGWWYLRGASRPRLAARFVALYFELPPEAAQQLAESADLGEADLRRPRMAEPASVDVLPAAVRHTLGKRGCLIPQWPGETARSNVAHGAFLGAGSDDWAVLCAIGDTGKILVFHGGAGAPVATLRPRVASLPHLDRLPDPFALPGASFGCVGAIFTVDAATVRPALGSAMGEDQNPAPLSAAERAAPLHEAIGEGDCEGLSQLLYWTGTRWVRLPGAD